MYRIKLYGNRAATTLALDAAIKVDQRDRMFKADLALKTKLTKEAGEDKRIATTKQNGPYRRSATYQAQARP